MCDFDIMERKDSNTYMTNYVRLCYVAQYENRKLLEELLNFKTSQNNVCAKSLNHKLRHYLEKEENDLLFDCVNSNSFSKLNQRVLYLVLSNSDLVDPPSNGWNGTSSTTETIGDCVKLIQQKYDLTFNKGNTKFTDEQVKTLFSLFKDIAGKFEHWLQKNEGELVLRYDQIQSCCFDIEMRTKYREHLHLLESRLIDSNQPGKHPDTYNTDSTQLSTEVTNTMRVTYVFQVVLVEIFQKYMASLITPAKFRTKTSNNLQLYHSLPKHLEDFRIINNQSKNVDAILRETIIIKSRANARMTDSEMVEHFRFLKRIVKDLEEKMKEKMYLPNGKLVAELKYYKTCCMDDQISTWYHESLIDLAEREYHFGTSIHFPDTERTTRFWYINHVSEDTLQGLTRDDPVSKYVLIGYAFEEKLSKTIGELLSICVPHCLLFSKLFCAQNFEYFNAEEYLLFFESQKNGYIDFNTVLLSSVMLCLKKTKDYKFLKHIKEKKKKLMNREKKELNEKEMRQYLRSFKELEHLYLRPKRKYDSLIEQLENLLMEEEQLKVLFDSLAEKKKKQQPIWMKSKCAKQTPSSSLLDSKEFYELLANGFYLSYDNRVYLGGPCNSGKTSLAYIFMGKEVPATWDSTNGLQIYFGQNGIHLKDRKMIPTPKGMLCNTAFGKVISAINEMQKGEKETKLVVEINDKNERADLKEDGSFHNLDMLELKEIDKTDSQSDIKDNLDITKCVSMQTQKLDDYPFGESKTSDSEISKTQSHIPEPSPKALNVIQEEVLHKNILDEVRSGEYNLEIAPSDIVDFGGQKAFDLTHQLFILQEGTVLLLFNGSKDLNEPLPEYRKEKISSADILLHWVDSVSTYCSDENGMQRIQFVATHSDRYKDNLEIRRTELVTQLNDTFREHEKRSYLFFENLFFINATNKDDNEIDKLKDELVNIAFSQKSWGKKMPLIWVPLEKQIDDFKRRGTSILRIEEIQELNKSNEDLMMDDENLFFFLRTQHAIGKFVFFDQDELAKFVIIEPSVLVNALRSFVTDEMFFPSNDKECYQILKNLQMNGMLKKNDLKTLWKQNEFQAIFKNEVYKDFIEMILLRLDVLVKPTVLNQNVNFPPKYYIVPSMIQTRLDNDYAKEYLNENRSICMAYVFKVHTAPPCLFYRLVASAVGIWPFKKYQEQNMFFQDIATFVLDKGNEFSLIMNGRKIVVYFTNAKAKHIIQPHKVASVQECLSEAMKSITEFYQLHSRRINASYMIMFEKPFDLEYGAACKTPCFVKREEELRLSKTGMWKCQHDKSHEAEYLWYWDSKKNKTNAQRRCTMADISPNVLMQKPPADLLSELSFAVGIDGETLGLNLGVESSDIEHMVISNRYNIFEKTLKILDYWKMSDDSVTVKHLAEGLQTIGGRGIETIVEYYRYQNTADLPHVRTTASDLQSLSFKSPVMRCRSNSLPSLRSPLANNKEGKDWFYKLKIYCDMYDLHLIIARTLETKYKSLAETVNQKDILTSLIEKKKCSKSFMSVFEKIYQLTICSISTSSEEICEQNELLFRFILARNLCPFKVSNLLRQAMEAQMHKLCKAFSWYLLRSMIKETSISYFFSQVKDIWPGFFCKCSQRKKGHSAICSKEPVIVIDADEYLEGLPGEIYGIPVKQSAYYLATENTQESDISIEQNYSCEDMTTVSGENAKELFLPHTKLTLIYKSITQPRCVILCCQAKGIIPMGEKHLPAVVCSMNTKVLHGNVSFLHKMKVGSKVGPAGSWGTLGGFVQRRGRDAFLTCAHVVYDRKVLLCGNKRNKNKEEVIVNCYVNGEANAFICGSVIDDKFIYDKCDKTSIDAAVVILDRNTSSIDNDEIVQVIDTDGNQSTHPAAFLGMTSAYLNDNYISNKIEKGEMKARLVGAKSGYFEGNVKYEDYDADKQTFEDGLEHGVVVQWASLADQLEKVKESNVKPLHVKTDVHFQYALLPKLDKMAKHDRHFVRFYNQLLIENFKFQAGDSGTCIYIVEDKSFTRADNEPNPKGCIGMAIAGYTDVRDRNIKTIVTPMKAILEAFDLI